MQYNLLCALHGIFSRLKHVCLILDAKPVRFETASVSREIRSSALAFCGEKAKIATHATNQMSLEPSCR